MHALEAVGAAATAGASVGVGGGRVGGVLLSSSPPAASSTMPSQVGGMNGSVLDGALHSCKGRAAVCGVGVGMGRGVEEGGVDSMCVWESVCRGVLLLNRWRMIEGWMYVCGGVLGA